MFLKHFPKEIREIVPPKSEKERQMSIILGVPLGLLFIGSHRCFDTALASRPAGKPVLLGTLRACL